MATKYVRHYSNSNNYVLVDINNSINNANNTHNLPHKPNPKTNTKKKSPNITTPNIVDTGIVDTNIVDTDIVLVCHCKADEPVYYTRTKIPVSDDISYVEPTCKNSKWKTINSNSKKYVWGINCPVNPVINIDPTFDGNIFFTPLLSILEGAYRVLIDGGKVVFPGRFQFPNLVEVMQNKLNTNHHLASKWIFSIELHQTFPLSLCKGSVMTHLLPLLAVFTKQVSIGGFRNIKQRQNNKCRYTKITNKHKNKHKHKHKYNNNKYNTKHKKTRTRKRPRTSYHK